MAVLKNILVVDDNAINLKVLCKMLAKFDEFNIVTAKDGQKAVDLCREQNFDLIYMDLQMPVLDGWDATQIICDEKLGCQEDQCPVVIAVSANQSSEDQAKAFAAGVVDFIAKPVTVEKIKNSLAKWLYRVS